MAFNVRIFGYNGLTQMYVSQQRRLATDTVWMAEEPPVWSALGVSNGATPLQLLGPLASNARTAGNLSRRMSGFDHIPWVAGATFSFVDAASFL